ncbi:replication initiation protein [Desulfotalea psychrophila]|nr:replication initiation protein [Desulfotalea psychrophila]
MVHLPEVYNPHTLVRKSTKMLSKNYCFTEREGKFIDLMIAVSDGNAEDFDSLRFSISQLAEYYKIKPDGAYKAIQEITAGLITKGFQLTTTSEEGAIIVSQSSFLCQADYNKGKGTVDVRFSPIMKKYLLSASLKSYIAYPIGMRNEVVGGNVWRFYEIIRLYSFLGKKTLVIDELKVLMGLTSKYKQPTDFIKYVIEKAMVEIPLKTEMYFSYKTRKLGRKTHFLDLIIIDKDAQAILKMKFNSVSPEHYRDLIGYGISPKKILSMDKSGILDESRVVRNIEYTLSEDEKGKVDTIAAFISSAITGDWAKKSPYKKKKETREKEKDEKDKKSIEEIKAYQKRKDKEKILDEEYSLYCNSQFEKYLDKNIEKFTKQFLDNCHDGIKSTILRKISSLKTIDEYYKTVIFEVQAKLYYRKNILDSSVNTFEKWLLKTKGIKF